MRLYYATKHLDRMASDKTYQPKDIHPDVVRAFRKTVGLVAAAKTRQDLRAMKGLRLEKLSGDRKGKYSMRVNDQWRIIASFESEKAGWTITLLELIDYH